MTTMIVTALLAASDSVATSIVVKATAATSIATLLAQLVRKRRASLQHLVFVAAFVALVVIPIASLTMPTRTVAFTTGAIERPFEMRADGCAAITTPDAHEAGTFKNMNRPISTTTVLFVVWAAGACLFLLPV